MIAIIDYGMGNIHSVRKAVESAGAAVLVTNKAAEIKKCDKVILPGVGAFGDAASELEEKGITRVLKEVIREKRIFLGICLGLQLLFDASEESPGVKGLGVFTGGVRRFKTKPGFKVPHMGWNQLNRTKECPLFKDVPEYANVYFCHSYYVDPEEQEVVAGSTQYIENFASLVWKDSVFGVQFHPEKSQKIGLQIIRNFVDM